jgi:hypothetical protein
MLNVFMLIVIMLNVFYAECHSAECHYADCHYSECPFAECCGAHQTCSKLKRASACVGSVLTCKYQTSLEKLIRGKRSSLFCPPPSVSRTKTTFYNVDTTSHCRHDTQLNDIQHNDVRHNNKKNVTLSLMTLILIPRVLC